MNAMISATLRSVVLAVAGSSLVSSSPAQALSDATNQSAGTELQARFESNQIKADQGDPEALFALARAYDHGTGVAKDISKAVDYARQSAEKGYAPAQTALGAFYWSGEGVPKDMVTAINWYRKAADQGYALAQYAMGTFYESGNGVSSNIDQAIVWFKKAADQNNAAAECQLGLLYFTGVKGDANHPDFTEAVKWLKKSADQGYAGAMNNLGLAYDSGLGGLPVNSEIAAKWFKQSAEYGNPKSQASLGEMYRTGRGVPRDLVQAYMWLYLAGAGNLDGKHSTVEVEPLLGSNQRGQARRLIQDYQTRHAVDPSKTSVN